MCKKFSAKELYEAAGARTVGQKLGLSAMVMAVLMEPANNTGFTWDKLERVERVVYGSKPNLAIRISTVAGMCGGNELCDEVLKAFPNFKVDYRFIWKFIDGKEIVPGVCYHYMGN